MVNYEYFYPGTPSTLEPSYGDNFTGYTMRTSQLAMALDPRTANQLQELNNKLNTGLKTAEIQGLQPAEFESIPNQVLKETNRLAGLMGVDVTLHGSLIEASGFSREGWSEPDRKAAERQMKQVIERAHILDDKGNIPVTFHSTVQLPEGLERVKENGKEVTKSVSIVDPETGRTYELKDKKRYFPNEPQTFDVNNEIKRVSEESWRDTLTRLAFDAARGRDFYQQYMNLPATMRDHLTEIKEKKLSTENLPEEEQKMLNNVQRSATSGEIFMREGYREIKELFEKSYRSALENTSNSNPEAAEKARNDLVTLDKFKSDIDAQVKQVAKDPYVLPDIVEKGLKVLNEISIPQLYKPLNEFVLEKSSQTFAEAALFGYKKFKDSAPIVSIENPPAGGGLSRAEDLRDLIEKSRKKFVEKAIADGISESEAEKAAKKLIGATWDVGHINMIRKFGYDSEDMVKQAGIIKPFVNKVHLSDNFGMEHTELPMGMGNVPIKEILEKLGKEGFEAKKVVEAGNWWQHFSQQGKIPPIMPTLEAFGSPLYPMLAQPGWNQISNTYGNYFSTPSAYLPDYHFGSVYGGGWSSVPQEVGGQMPGQRSRATGTPMD